MLTEAPPLPAWLDAELPFRRRMLVHGDDRVHFVDHGEGPVVWLQHGNPTWCFLWRKVIPRLRGFRVIAPDLIGLGLSSKPRRAREHTLLRHLEVQNALYDALDPGPTIFVGQDWGGPVSAGIAMAHPDRVAGLVFGNTAVVVPRRPMHSKPFHRFSHFPLVSDAVFRLFGFPQNGLHRTQGDPASMDRTARRAYRWPLRRIRDRAAPLGLARMVPNGESHPTTPVIDAIGRFVQSWEGPAGLVWGVRDPILGRGLRRHREALPQARVWETQAGHFLQEEVPEAFEAAIRHVSEAG